MSGAIYDQITSNMFRLPLSPDLNVLGYCIRDVVDKDISQYQHNTLKALTIAMIRTVFKMNIEIISISHAKISEPRSKQSSVLTVSSLNRCVKKCFKNIHGKYFLKCLIFYVLDIYY